MQWEWVPEITNERTREVKRRNEWNSQARKGDKVIAIYFTILINFRFIALFSGGSTLGRVWPGWRVDTKEAQRENQFTSDDEWTTLRWTVVKLAGKVSSDGEHYDGCGIINVFFTQCCRELRQQAGRFIDSQPPKNHGRTVSDCLDDTRCIVAFGSARILFLAHAPIREHTVVHRVLATSLHLFRKLLQASIAFWIAREERSSTISRWPTTKTTPCRAATAVCGRAPREEGQLPSNSSLPPTLVTPKPVKSAEEIAQNNHYSRCCYYTPHDRLALIVFFSGERERALLLALSRGWLSEILIFAFCFWKRGLLGYDPLFWRSFVGGSINATQWGRFACGNYMRNCVIEIGF